MHAVGCSWRSGLCSGICSGVCKLLGHRHDDFFFMSNTASVLELTSSIASEKGLVNIFVPSVNNAVTFAFLFSTFSASQRAWC